MFTRSLCVLLSGWLVGLLAQTASAVVITNFNFADYGPVSPPAALNTLPVHGWAETGAGGHSLVGQTFGAWSARSGGINGVLLTTVGKGIRQKISGFTVGPTYVIDNVYAQTQTPLHPTVSVKVFDGDSLDPVHLLSSWDYTLDANRFGDGNLESTYVGLVTPVTDTVTLLYTLKAKDGPNDLGPILWYTSAEVWTPEPSSAILLLGGVVSLFAFRRRR